jgi:release factor glutamine methyltransferase
VTVAQWLAASGLPLAEARALLAAALGVRRERLVAYPERAVPDDAGELFARFTERRRAGEPLAYLLGVREFYGREFAVGPAVLIPRPETELLVELALHRVARAEAPRIVDLGTGSGCIAITLALELPHAAVTAIERSAEALHLARRNAQRLGAHIELLQGDWYAPLEAERRFDAIVANPPYVAVGDPHLHEGDLRFEPALALTDGSDGLACLRAVVAGAPAHLAAAGWLGVEHGYNQGAAARELFAAAGFQDIATVRDAAGIERVTHGRAPR